MLCALNEVLRTAPDAVAEESINTEEQASRIAFRMRLDHPHDFTGKADESLGAP